MYNHYLSRDPTLPGLLQISKSFQRLKCHNYFFVFCSASNPVQSHFIKHLYTFFTIYVSQNLLLLLVFQHCSIFNLKRHQSVNIWYFHQVGGGKMKFNYNNCSISVRLRGTELLFFAPRK
jgi:hypothetical protein